VNTPTEISNLELSVDSEEEVLRLDISMDDVFPMEVGESVGHLSDVLERASEGD